MVAKDDPKLNRKLIEILDEAINTGPWDKGLFFQNIGKKLRDLRERFARELDLGEGPLVVNNEANKNSMHLANRVAQRAGQVEVFISLYIAEGGNMKKWEQALQSLAGHSISRPVYKNEKDIKDAIRAKEFKQNDAYVAVYVAEEDILIPVNGKVPVDRNGRELLVLRENAIQLENIIRFVHISGQYRFDHNSLSREANVEFF